MPSPKPEWDPQSEEDRKHLIRRVLDREPTAGEMMMLTIRLHMEHPKTIPRIADAVQRLRRTAEYRHCTGAWDERAATRPAVSARVRGLEVAPRRSVALPGETELATTERAMRDLLAGFPSSLGHSIGNERLSKILQTLDDAQVLALRGVCQNGRVLAEQVRDLTERSSYLNVSTGQVFGTEGYLMDVLPDLDAKGRAQAQLHRAVARLVWEAHHEQVGGPVLKASALEWWDVGSTALGAVEAAVRMLGPEADARTVRREAIRLMIDYLDSMTDDERDGEYRYEVGLAIKRLVNVRDVSSGILTRVRIGLPPVISLGT